MSSIGIIAMRAGCAVLSLVGGVVVARHLGPNGFGIYSWALAVLNLSAVPAQIGLPPLVVRETVKASESAEWPLVKGLWLWATAVVTASSLLTSAVVLTVGWHIADPPRYQTLIAAMVLATLLAVGNIRAAALRGLHHTTLGQLPEFIVRPVVAVVSMTVISLSLKRLQWTPQGAMAIQCFAALTAFAVGAILLRILRPAELVHCGQARYAWGEWTRSAKSMTLMSILAVANQSVSVLVLSFLATDSDAGLYAAVSGLAAIISFGLQAVSVSAGPHLARLHARGEQSLLQACVTRNSRATLAFAIPAALVVILGGRELLTRLYGVDFAAGGQALAILGLGQLFNASAGTVGLLLVMTGNEWYAAKSLFLAIIVNVSLCCAMIPQHGATGAAVASAGSLVVWNISMWRHVHAKLHIEACGLLSAGRTVW
jgi:O-antigen/teichoic acid export membrane protein